MTAAPVRHSNSVYRQPDGSTFSVNIIGDEWTKIRTTENGCAIIQEEDGWWCYAQYDSEGNISSTGYHVGNAPADIKAAARNIPYSVLAEKAAEKKAVGRGNTLRTIKGIRKQTASTKSGGTSIQKRAIILLVEFSDTKFKYTKEDFSNLLNQKNYNNTGCAKDYYESQFGEGWEFSFDLSDIITLERPYKHYGANDSQGDDVRPWDMIAEACQKADAQIDFSLYDQDNDGEVDNVYVFYAGQGENEHDDKPDLIWPHQYYIYSGDGGVNLKLDGKRIDRYACSSEISGERDMTGIGTFCHEYGHTFGLVDLYDTDYDEAGGWAAGTWSSTSLMDGGSYNNNSATPPNFNCIEREMLNLSKPTKLELNKSYTIEPIHLNGTYCRLDTDTDGEYYLFECRSKDGWDKYVGGEGMLVYHIDKNETIRYGRYEYNVWEWNAVNATLSHQCADIIEADGRSDQITSYSDLDKDISGIFFPTKSVTSIGAGGAPALKYWNGNSSKLAITGIRIQDKNISFNVIDPNYVAEVPSVTNLSYTTFPDAVVISFEASDPSLDDAKAILEWRKTGSEDSKTTIYPTSLGDGKYTCKIDGLTSGNISYDTHIRFERDGSISKELKLVVMTKRKPAVDWPYIYISDNSVDKSKGLVLHVVNASEAAEVIWSYNDEDITSDLSHKLYPIEDGTLKAEVIWKNGSKDIIIKNIKVVN